MTAERPEGACRWQFDGEVITVHIPMTFAHRGGRKMFLAPDGGNAWVPARPNPDEALIRALACAHRWKRLFEQGKYRSAAELAEAEDVSRSFITRLVRLTLLAPDIVEVILDGRHPEGMQLKNLTRPLPSAWDEQRRRLMIGSAFE